MASAQTTQSSRLSSSTNSANAVAVAAAVGLVLAGCAVGPSYQRPAASLADFHHAVAVQSPAAGAPPPLEHWWNGFNDPELSRIVDRALTQNLDLAAAFARVQQARAAAREAGAQLAPAFDATAQAETIHQSLEGQTGRIASRLPGFERDASLYDVGVGASWEIDLFGGLRRGADAARAEAQAAEAERLGVRVSVAAEAADAYFRIRGDQARLAVAADQITTDAGLLKLVQLRFERGLGADREVAQAEALLSQAKASVQPLNIDLQAQLNRLDVLMGVQPGAFAAELGAPVDIPGTPSIPADSKPVDVLRRRPDVIAAERRVAAANARIGQSIAEYYPKISLSGLLGFESASPGHLFRAATYQPEAVGGLRWRLFDFGRIDAEVRQARGAEAEALAQYRQSVLRAAQDVEDAFTALAQLEAHRDELVREVAALTRARDLARDAYLRGAIALTDVLDADRQLLAAKDELAQTRTDAARAAVQSFRALGGGWSS
ncbi:efflux transporter outer membrane subunit [Phenylobacterium montanum]|uniref:Efflux transporter outer membrane subunit n=1 Tax=Phenylobacterium montanum TaxID=2823693 RepID=A0A975IXN9_9CAUL|nr:efflux transporter outer membrane subunit [Caulobacter sp. S6]QUD89611.1 efflux transporter outer membrane subunit [Caulobacter sp. S6]